MSDFTHHIRRLFGRQDEISSIRQALADPDRYGCLVVGAPGSGKTAVMNAALNLMVDGATVHRLRGAETTHGREQRVLETFLALEDPTTHIGAGSTLSKLARMFGPTSPETRPIVFIDRANLLDSTSLSVLSLLAESKRIRLLAGTESVDSPVDSVADLWLSGKITRIDLGGLDEDAIAEMSDSIGHIGRSPAELSAATAGNPRLLNQALSFQRQMLVSDQSLEGVPREFDAVLETIAMTNALPYACLSRLCSPHNTDSLFETGILSLTSDEEPAVVIDVPTTASLLTSRVGPARSLSLFTMLGERVKRTEFSGQSLFGLIKWGLSLGVKASAHETFDAALWANSNGNYGQAADLVHECGHENDELILELARSEKGLGHARTAQELFDKILASVDPDLPNAQYLSRMACMDMRLTDPRRPEALRTLWVRDRLDEPEDTRRHDVTRAWFDLKGGRLGASLDSASRVAVDYSALPRHRLRACALLGVGSVFHGRIDIGLDYIDQAEQMFEFPGLTSYEREDATAQFFIARFAGGDWENARSSMQLAGAGKRMSDFAEALVDIRTGHLVRGHATLASVLAHHYDNDIADLTWIGLAAKNYVETVLGISTDTSTQAALLDAREEHYSWWSDYEVQLFDLQSLALREPDRAGTSLYNLGRSCLNRGAVTLAVLAWIDAARLGHERAIAELERSASDIHGRLGDVAAAVSTAMRTQESSALLAAARRAADFGSVVWSAGLAKLAQQSAIRTRNRQVLKEARNLLGSSTGKIRFGEQISLQMELSEFEGKLVAGVIDGKSSQDLGVKHHLSPRTIEWHLSRIYRRMHVTNRQELRDVAAIWRGDE